VNLDLPKEFAITNKARWFHLVRVCTISKGERKPSMGVYTGRRDSSGMDPT
jgi:hypothetical protein